jgi:hypothetical protein
MDQSKSQRGTIGGSQAYNSNCLHLIGKFPNNPLVLLMVAADDQGLISFVVRQSGSEKTHSSSFLDILIAGLDSQFSKPINLIAGPNHEPGRIHYHPASIFDLCDFSWSQHRGTQVNIDCYFFRISEFFPAVH